MKGVRHRLVRRSVPNGLVFVGELPYGSQGSFSPKMDHLVSVFLLVLQFNSTKRLWQEKSEAEAYLEMATTVSLI